MERRNRNGGTAFLPAYSSPPPKSGKYAPAFVDLNLQDQIEQIGASTFISAPAPKLPPEPAYFRLLRDTIAIQRAEPERLPRNQVATWRMLQDAGYSWTSDEWKSAIQGIRGYLDIRDRTGTYVGEEWGDVASLHFALETTHDLSPTLPD